MTPPITIALPKGRLFSSSLDLFRKIGLSHPDLSTQARQLSFDVPDEQVRLVIVRDVDVSTYVEYGAADLGIVGKDRLLEEGPSVYEPIDLRFGFCRIVLAEPADTSSSSLSGMATRRVATKFPRLTERVFLRKGLPVEIIKLSGAIELAPLVGLADQIVDVVDTGETLKAHHLVEIEELAQSTARLIVNRASFKTKCHRIQQILQQLMDVVGR